MKVDSVQRRSEIPATSRIAFVNAQFIPQWRKHEFYKHHIRNCQQLQALSHLDWRIFRPKYYFLCAFHHSERSDTSFRRCDERVDYNRHKNATQTADHVQHNVGKFSRNRSGRGDHVPAHFPRTRNLPPNRPTVDGILPYLPNDYLGVSLSNHDLLGTISHFKRGTLHSHEILVKIRQHCNLNSFNGTYCV